MVKNILGLVGILFISFSAIYGQTFVMPLYPEGAIPNHVDMGEQEIHDSTEIVRIRNVQKPDIAVFLPSKRCATGQAVVICPGGGYRILAYDWEGTDVAKWLNSKGIAAIVLKYRLPSSASVTVAHETPLLDAQRAMRLVRHNALRWNINPRKIGVMGFSAGGHLASTLSTHFDKGNAVHIDPVERMSCRPDFSILMYPVISSDTSIWHEGSFTELLGQNPSEEQREYYSNEKQVQPDTPPTILVHSADDKAVPVANSIMYFNALLAKGIPAELHVYPYGGHGYSLAVGRGYLSGWTERVADWLKALEEPGS